MATAEDKSAYGAGGKFKKRPFRRSTQTTPYDRPPTALRDPTNININNNGWLSKLVEPAQRLVVSSAHRIFDSVLRKRLTPAPPPPLEPEANREATNVDKEQVSTDQAGVQGVAGRHDDLNNSSDRGGLTELEQILKQKTFSRSEIDRLTALLQSRTVEMSVRDEQRSPEVIPSKPVVLHNGKEAPVDTPFKENGIANQLISTPVASSTVLDEDIASPAELAKAYMGSRPSKVSPSMLGVRGPLPSASPVLSHIPRSSGHVAIPENGFVTPRSRGRSAIYSMPRAPHSRMHSTTAFKSAGLTIDSFAGPSSSPQGNWEKNRLIGSKHDSLKRRSSVLDSDIGSVGPIRRIRQKPNLLPSKSLRLPSSGSPLSVRGSGVTDTVQHPSSLSQRDYPTKMLTENGDNSFPSTSATPVPSKSSEMASKILQQLDKLVSSREKSPTKLSPSMLCGPALKSLENVDSSIFMDVQDNKRSNGSLDTPLPDFRDSSSQKQDKVEETDPTKIFSPKLIPSTNDVDTAGIIKDNVPSTKMTDFALTNSAAHPHPQKKRAFQMSAREDYLEVDGDDYSNGPPSISMADGVDKPNASLDDKTTAAEAITVEKSPAHSDVKEKNDGAIVAGKGTVFAFPTVPSPSMTVQPAEVAPMSTLTSNKAANGSSGSPIFSFGGRFASPKESKSVSPSFSIGTTNVDKAPQLTSASLSSVISEPSIFKFGAPLNSKLECSTSLASDAVGATDSVTKVPESVKADNSLFSRAPETSLPSAASTSSSAASIFSFGGPANNSNLDNGSLTSCPSSTSSPTPLLISNTGFNQNLFCSSTFGTTNSDSTSVITSSATTPTAAPIFKLGSSPVPSISTSTSPILATSGIESTEVKNNETSFGNSTSVLFGASPAFVSTGRNTSNATSDANTGTISSIFGGTLAAFSTSTTSGGTSSATTSTGGGIFAGASPRFTSTGNSSFGGTSSTVANTGSSIFGFSAGAFSLAAPTQGHASNPFAAGSAQASINATSVATTTQSMPTQFGSTSSSSSFGLVANPTFTSSSSMFGSLTSVSKPFGSVPSFGLSSSTSSSEANSLSSSSGTTTSVFGSSWQSPKTPLFGSTVNSTSPSTTFSFGASASSAASSAQVFGSSTNASSSSMFPFTSAAIATSSQPSFGSTNSVFAFGSVPSNNNDQMNVEDSMAEDTDPTSTPVVPAFGQQPVSPSSGFVFGSTASSEANPFQFGSHQNLATPQNPSPFQASGSLDFNAGGSFSLGAGGGDKSQRRMVKVRKQRKK